MFYPATYTVESVTSGHPDKICDQISDAILDEAIKQDPNSRVAIETFGSHNLLIIGGELTTKAKINYTKIARKIYYKDIGYTNKLKIITEIAKQSPDIALGVNSGGAGDQGIMYGFASNETKELLPYGLVIAQKLAARLEALRKNDPKFRWLKPDGKTQVTIKNYNKIDTILVSCQHTEDINKEDIEKYLIKYLIQPTIGYLPKKILINPTGRFIKGGFEADTGLTGRKIMVDSYGGLIPHGGGCFSGKDPSKVDRSGAYMARYVAKNMVANGLAKQCLVSIAYAIGKAEPLMIYACDEKNKNLSKFVKKRFDFRPQAIIEKLKLRQPFYLKTSTYGHFGKNYLPWEKVERI